MFRIKKIFENEQTVLFKVEGEIVESDLDDWSNWLESLFMHTNKQFIIEFCHLVIVTQKGVEKLFEHMRSNVYLLNCPTAVTNIAHSLGFSKNVLD